MPIYEFKCVMCGEYIELLLMNTKKENDVDLYCKKCGSKNLERIISVTNCTVSRGNVIEHKKKTETVKETRSCSSGSCTTYTIPGPA